MFCQMIWSCQAPRKRKDVCQNGVMWFQGRAGFYRPEGGARKSAHDCQGWSESQAGRRSEKKPGKMQSGAVPVFFYAVLWNFAISKSCTVIHNRI